jgi:hypothetical protein
MPVNGSTEETRKAPISRNRTLIIALAVVVVAGLAAVVITLTTGSGGDSPRAVSGPSSGAPSAGPAVDPQRKGQPDCAPKPSDCGYPDATNTGVPAGTKLEVMTGDQKITEAGTVIEGKDIRGCITVVAPHVTIRN